MEILCFNFDLKLIEENRVISRSRMLFYNDFFCSILFLGSKLFHAKNDKIWQQLFLFVQTANSFVLLTINNTQINLKVSNESYQITY